MEFRYKNIHIGKLIEELVKDRQVEMDRITQFLKISVEKVHQVYHKKSIDSEQLLLWSKLLEYDFFRIYSQHLLLYSPSASTNEKKSPTQKSPIPQFRKNLYTTEIVEFILELVENEEITISEITKKYNIPRTTLYKWVKKHKKYDT